MKTAQHSTAGKRRAVRRQTWGGTAQEALTPDSHQVVAVQALQELRSGVYPLLQQAALQLDMASKELRAGQAAGPLVKAFAASSLPFLLLLPSFSTLSISFVMSQARVMPLVLLYVLLDGCGPCTTLPSIRVALL